MRTQTRFAIKWSIRLLISVSLCFTVGCAVFGSRKVYRSPHGNFVFPLPEAGLLDNQAKIQEDSDHLGGRVVFSDPWFTGILIS